MSAPANALPLDADRAGEPQQTIARSVQDHYDTSAFDKPQVGRDVVPPYNHRGTVVVASAWLAFYVIAVLMASGNSLTQRSTLGAEVGTRSAVPPTQMMTERAAAH